jgi:Tfp pilus assembly protein PilF
MGNLERLQEAAQLAQGPAPEKARPLIERLLKDVPDLADGWTVKGLVEQRAGNAEAAISAFRRAVDLDPQSPEKLSNLGVALKNAGRPVEALPLFERGLRIRPNAPSTLNNLGSALLVLDRPREAAVRLEAAIAQRPAYPEAWHNLGIARKQLGDLAGARLAYEKALNLNPAFLQTHLNLADLLFAEGAVPHAIAACEAILKRWPQHWAAENNRGVFLEANGQLREAAAAFRRVWMENPALEGSAINLARVLLMLDDAVGAHEVCEQALNLPGAAATTPLALKTVALARLGRLAEREALLDIDRFVRITDHHAVPGYAERSQFDAELVGHLRQHPSLTFEPAGLVTRTGNQSSELIADEARSIRTLEAMIRDAVAGYLKELDGDSGAPSPFMARRPDQWSLTLWGTILQPGGSVEAHIHAPNWLSGVYYPELPAGLAEAEPAGWFEVGRAPEGLGGPDDPVRCISPREGRMILFPSFFYHRTVPFHGGGERISFAFDIVPAGHGRPHRLGNA